MSPVKVAEKQMTMAQIKAKARDFGIDSGSMKKTELIHAIQRAEGFNACYGTSNGQCPFMECCFRKDCLKIKN